MLKKERIRSWSQSLGVIYVSVSVFLCISAIGVWDGLHLCWFTRVLGVGHPPDILCLLQDHKIIKASVTLCWIPPVNTSPAQRPRADNAELYILYTRSCDPLSVIRTWTWTWVDLIFTWTRWREESTQEVKGKSPVEIKDWFYALVS